MPVLIANRRLDRAAPRQTRPARAEPRARCGDIASGNLKATNEKEVPDWPGGGWVGAGRAIEEPGHDVPGVLSQAALADASTTAIAVSLTVIASLGSLWGGLLRQRRQRRATAASKVTFFCMRRERSGGYARVKQALSNSTISVQYPRKRTAYVRIRAYTRRPCAAYRCRTVAFCGRGDAP